MTDVIRRIVHRPPARVLLCLEGCFEEFYLPLEANEHAVCPVDSEHAVAVYRQPILHASEPLAYREGDADDA